MIDCAQHQAHCLTEEEIGLEGMHWDTLKFSKSVVDKTGDAFRADVESGPDFAVISNWRSIHNFPLNSIQNGLRTKAKSVYRGCILAKRIKRLVSIIEKLKGARTMRLSAMQDIGGCRAIMGDVPQVLSLRDSFKNRPGLHKLVEENDYISEPKPSGYRGIHLVYKYAGSRKEYHGLKIEVQLRSAMQHAWATAVETVDLFTKQALKSNRGNDEWLRFFSLMGTAIAKMENCTPVPSMPTDKKLLRRELMSYQKRLDVVGQLSAYGHALHELPGYANPRDHYFILVIDPITKELEVSGYSSYEFRQASRDYLDIESRIGEKNAVLVSVDSIDELRTAYPNYFLDTTVFIDLIGRALE